MNTLISNVLRHDTKRAYVGALVIFIFLFLSVFSLISEAIEVDLSRRTNPLGENQNQQDSVVLDQLKSKFIQPQPIVILNTAEGFVPSKVVIKQGTNYKFFIANVNESEKKTSFLFEAFQQNHETYFGKLKTFIVQSKVSGVFQFLSPETGAKGEVIVKSSEDSLLSVDETSFIKNSAP